MQEQRPNAIQHFRVLGPGCLKDRVSDFGITPRFLQHLLNLGAIYWNGRRLFQDDTSPSDLSLLPVNEGDILRIHFRPRRFFWAPDQVKSWIKAESKHTLLVEKPSGLPTHATLDNAREHLLHHLHAAGYPEALMVNRLDVGTEGLLLFARDPRTQKNLHQQTQERSLLKFYSALVEGHFPFEGEMMTWMQKSERAPKQQHFSPAPDRESCLTFIKESRLLDGSEEGVWSRLRLELITGRTHQIRSQLQAFGHSIVGDRMYGSHWAWLDSTNDSQGSKKHLPPTQAEAWALRCQALRWEDDGGEHFYELADFTAADLQRRKKTPSSVLSRSDFEFSAELQSARFLHKNPPGIRSLEARRYEDTLEPQSQKPQ